MSARKDVGVGAEIDVETLQAEIKQLRAELGTLSNTIREVVRERGAEAVTTAREAGERVWAEAKEHLNGVAKEIEANPLAATAAAFGLGVLVATLLRGRRD